MQVATAVADHGQVDNRTEPVPELDPADLAEAARQLRALVEALPPTTARDRATARRIEGAAVALEAVGLRLQSSAS